MKRPDLLHIAALLACIFLASCTNTALDDEVSVGSDRKNEYTKSWIDTFGLIDNEQDWCTVSEVTADISLDGDVRKVEVYNGDPAEGAHIICSTTAGGRIAIDMPDGAPSVYGRRYGESGSVVDEGFYAIRGGHVSIDRAGTPRRKAASRAGTPTYAHTPSYFEAMVICEDLGSIGDFDFNDIVIGLKHVSGDNPTLTLVPMAAGGTLEANIYFKNQLVGEIHDLIRPGASHSVMLNTRTNDAGLVTNMRSKEISLAAFPGWTIASNWSDITIVVVNKDETVNITAPLIGRAPQMICLGGDWFWPRETVSIKRAYQGFTSWSCDANATTWLGDWVDAIVVKWSVPAGTDPGTDPGVDPGTDPDPDPEPEPDPEDTRMWYMVTTTDGNPYSIRIDGSDTPATGESGVKYYVDSPWISCRDMFTVYSEEEAFILNREGNYILSHLIADNNVKTVEFSENFDMSGVCTFDRMFAGCSHLVSVNVDDWKMSPSELNSMEAMFKGCSSLTSLDLSGWDTSGITVLYDAFCGCSSLRTLNLAGWNILSWADVRYMFDGTSGLTVICSEALAGQLAGESSLGGTGLTFARP